MLAQQLRQNATRLAGQAPCAIALHSSTTRNTALFSTEQGRSDKGQAEPNVSQQSAPSESAKPGPQPSSTASSPNLNADRTGTQSSQQPHLNTAAVEQLQSHAAATSGPASSPSAIPRSPQAATNAQTASFSGRAPAAATPAASRAAPAQTPATAVAVQHTASFQGIPLHLGEEGSPLQVRYPWRC